MPRIVKEYVVRRDEILAAAQQLIAVKGYEQMTIQDILDQLTIAKGTFYYYFDSKQALLEAIIEQTLERIQHLVAPILDSAELTALEKLQRFFTAVTRWETGQKALILSLLRVWYKDENTVVREKTRASTILSLAPLLNRIIDQGVQEGTLDAPYQEEAGEIVLSVIFAMEDSAARLLLSADPEQNTLQRAERHIAAYNHALERLLGIPAGNLHLIDRATIKAWFENN